MRAVSQTVARGELRSPALSLRWPQFVRRSASVKAELASSASSSIAFCATSSTPITTTLLTSLRCMHIEHSSDVHKWRSPEKEEVKRQFRGGGVKLGSEFTKYREQETAEKALIEEDKFTNWRLVYAYSLGTALLLIGLNLVMVVVEPNPSPEYVPYVDPAAAATAEVATVERRDGEAVRKKTTA